jgi:2-methylcitrate dehydratase
MGMHFKLGLYEHQSAGALQGLIDLLVQHPEVRDVDNIDSIVVKAYEPAFGIIGDPAKRDPKTRQSADHSMVFIVSRMLHKAAVAPLPEGQDAVWKHLMLMPEDYSQAAIHDTGTRQIMAKMAFEHGGPEYDAKYPDGIPTSLVVQMKSGQRFDSGMVMYPGGHARNTTADLPGILRKKFERMATIAVRDGGDAAGLVSQWESIGDMSADALLGIYNFPLAERPGYE